jgi:hypothetical protein
MVETLNGKRRIHRQGATPARERDASGQPLYPYLPNPELVEAVNFGEGGGGLPWRSWKGPWSRTGGRWSTAGQGCGRRQRNVGASGCGGGNGFEEKGCALG